MEMISFPTQTPEPMKNLTKPFLALLTPFALAGSLFLGGCAAEEDDSLGDEMEEAGDAMQNAAEEAGENAEDAAEDAADEMEDTADEMSEEGSGY